MLRNLTASDVPAMIPLGIAFFEYAKLPGVFNVGRFSDVWTKLLESGSGLVVGYFDPSGVLRGGAGIYVTPDSLTTDTIAYEAFFYIDPAHRGRGVALLHQLETEARNAGAKRLWMVHLENEHANAMQRYYERQGFTLREHLYMKVLA